MDEKRGQGGISYDMGSEYNWKMVFGKNKALWWLPITTGDGAPLGDGVVINKIETSFSAMKDIESAVEDEDKNAFNDPLNDRYDRIQNQRGNPLATDVCKDIFICFEKQNWDNSQIIRDTIMNEIFTKDLYANLIRPCSIEK